MTFKELPIGAKFEFPRRPLGFEAGPFTKTSARRYSWEYSDPFVNPPKVYATRIGSITCEVRPID